MYKVFDLETTIRTSFKRTANPFDPLNFIVAVGWKDGKDKLPSHLYRKDGKLPFDWFTNLLQENRLLVGQNIKFDVLYALREPQNLEAWMKWVAAGGLVWDCQLAEYLLEGMKQEAQMLSLNELAVTYGGNVKIDEVKVLWDQGVNTPDIPEQLLVDYLVGRTDPATGERQEGDIGNTEIVFLGQMQRAKAANQMRSIMINMGSLLCTIEMERNGMCIDLDLGLTLAAEAQAELDELRTDLEQYLPKDLPFDFSWTNRYHLSPLIFGGQVKYDTIETVLDDATGGPAYFQKKETHFILTDGSTLNQDAWSDLYPQSKALDVARYTGGKNKGEAKTKQVTVPDLERGPKTRQAKAYYTFPGYTQPNPRWQGATPGLYSVSADVIESLGNRDIPFLKVLSKVAGLSKDIGTYYISTDLKTGEKKGMLSLVQDDGLGHWIIHHKINHTSTITARFSSSDPNLQNIPKEGKSKVKLTFISRFFKGKIVQSDFTSLEVYVQAILTKCQQLIDDLKLGLDMHCLRVSQVEGINYDIVFKLAKIDEDPVWHKKRTDAKVFSFQRAYGAGARKISESTGIPLEVVEALIAAEELRYPEIVAYFEARTEEIRRNRTPTNLFIQHPEVRGITCQLGRSYVRTPDNKLYTYRESPSPEYLVKRGINQSFSPTEIKNYEVQGEGGEWAKVAMWLAIREFYARKNFGGLALLVNQVHDALYADCDPSVEAEAASLLHACMEAASEFIEFFFDWEVPVPVPTETKSGANMLEEAHPPEGHKERAVQYRQSIRNKYMKGFVPSFEKESHEQSGSV